MTGLAKESLLAGSGNSRGRSACRVASDSEEQALRSDLDIVQYLLLGMMLHVHHSGLQPPLHPGLRQRSFPILTRTISATIMQ